MTILIQKPSIVHISHTPLIHGNAILKTRFIFSIFLFLIPLTTMWVLRLEIIIRSIQYLSVGCTLLKPAFDSHWLKDRVTLRIIVNIQHSCDQEFSFKRLMMTVDISYGYRVRDCSRFACSSQFGLLPIAIQCHWLIWRYRFDLQ